MFRGFGEHQETSGRDSGLPGITDLGEIRSISPSLVIRDSLSKITENKIKLLEAKQL